MKDDHVARIYRLLGEDAILLPIPPGKKKPVFDNWQKTTLAQTRTAQWQGRLREGNIGVLLVNGFVTIDCDTDDFAAELLALNPWLAGTLQTRGKRGRNFWLRLTGEYPQTIKRLYDRREQPPLEVGEWRTGTGQTVIHGEHPDGGSYRILVEAEPLCIDFARIIWPGWLKRPRPEQAEAGLPMQHSHTCHSATQPPSGTVSQPPSHAADTAAHVVGGLEGVLSKLERFLPKAEHQNDDCLFTLARELLDVEREEGRQLTLPELESVFDGWYARNEYLDPKNSRDHYWLKFLHAVDSAKVPLSQDALGYAIGKADSEPLPPVAAQFRDPGMQRLVAVMWQLWLFTRPEPFFITCRDAGAIAGVDYTTASRWLGAFCARRGGFLDPGKRGSFATREANEYRFREAPSQHVPPDDGF